MPEEFDDRKVSDISDIEEDAPKKPKKKDKKKKGKKCKKKESTPSEPEHSSDEEQPIDVQDPSLEDLSPSEGDTDGAKSAET